MPQGWGGGGDCHRGGTQHVLWLRSLCLGLTQFASCTPQGFDAYVLQEVLPVCFSAPAQPHFSVKDAAALPLLESSAALQKAILAKLGADLVTHLRDGLLPSLGCSPEASATAIVAQRTGPSEL